MGPFDEADGIVQAAVERGEIPGAVLHVRTPAGVAHERAFGRRRIDGAPALRADDLFPVASLTKLTVAVAMLQLCEDGAVGLDDPIVRYLPAFTDPTVLVSYDLETRATAVRPAAGPITIRHLLTHTAGIHHGFPRPDDVVGTLYERAGVVHGDGAPMSQKVERLGPLPLVHDPGRGWTYGLSSDVAGRLIEVVAAEPLDRYLARRVFAPLGIERALFLVPPDERARLVPPHVRNDGGTAVAPWADKDGEKYPSGGGGLHTTAADYGRFAQALLDGGAPILSPASAAIMIRNHIGDLTAAFGLKYGLSVGVATTEARGEPPLPVGGFGWYGIYGTWFWTLPSHRACVLLFTSVLTAGMNLPLFSRVVEAVDRWGTMWAVHTPRRLP